MIERIKNAEEKLDTIVKVLNELEVSIEKLDSIKELIKDVNKYYGSKNWFKDKKAFECGKIKNIKAGILSEDAVWDVLEKLNGYIKELNEIKDNIFE